MFAYKKNDRKVGENESMDTRLHIVQFGCLLIHLLVSFSTSKLQIIAYSRCFNDGWISTFISVIVPLFVWEILIFGVLAPDEVFMDLMGEYAIPISNARVLHFIFYRFLFIWFVGLPIASAICS